VDRPIKIRFRHVAATCQMEASRNIIDQSELNTWNLVAVIVVELPWVLWVGRHKSYMANQSDSSLCSIFWSFCSGPHNTQVVHGHQSDSSFCSWVVVVVVFVLGPRSPRTELGNYHSPKQQYLNLSQQQNGRVQYIQKQTCMVSRAAASERLKSRT
jgi:hypothetical protein